MRVRKLGRTGLEVSSLCLGAMAFRNQHWGCDEANSRAIVDRFLAARGDFIDTADIYGNGVRSSAASSSESTAPISGARSPEPLEDDLGAADLTSGEVALARPVDVPQLDPVHPNGFQVRVPAMMGERRPES
jgi:aryl-alcohol dehydrogenase-like predicted oxidoreductase